MVQLLHLYMTTGKMITLTYEPFWQNDVSAFVGLDGGNRSRNLKRRRGKGIEPLLLLDPWERTLVWISLDCPPPLLTQLSYRICSGNTKLYTY